MKYTIFTPTYNRAHLLPKIYQSLCIQKYKDLEWLVIDDGSYDNTEEVINSFILESIFPIRYIKQENGGKHRAFNKAIKEADSEWFVCVDSDDPLLPDAIKNMDKAISIINEKKEVAGIVGICFTPSGNKMGNVPDKYVFSDTIESRDKYHFQCEPEIYRLSILKNYEFPEFKGEKFITEAVLFDRLTVKHKLLYTNLPMQVKEYLQGGLTDKQLVIRCKSPNGTLTYYRQRYDLSYSFSCKFKAMINYCRFFIHAWYDKSILEVDYWKKSTIAMPLGFLMFCKDKLV